MMYRFLLPYLIIFSFYANISHQYSAESITNLFRNILHFHPHKHASLFPNLQLDPSNVKNYILRGNLFFRKNQYSHALSDFTKVLDTDSKNVECLYNRGTYC